MWNISMYNNNNDMISAKCIFISFEYKFWANFFFIFVNLFTQVSWQSLLIKDEKKLIKNN